MFIVYIVSMDIRIRDVDPVLHKRLKIATVEDGTSIQQVMLMLIEQYLERRDNDRNR